MSVIKDTIGTRMKSQYEDRTRAHLPRRTYTIIRVDGKAFHTYTHNAEKPFDYGLMFDMDQAALALCSQMMGCQCAYGQSDEYSFLLTDFAKESTEAWFDGNIQKTVSVAASVFGAAFIRARVIRCGAEEINRLPAFDARAFTIPDRIEVQNYFIWRQQDAMRNAIMMAGYAKFSPKHMHGLNVNQVEEKLFTDCGINFNDYPAGAKRGRAVYQERYTDLEEERTRWTVDAEMPILTQDREYFRSRLVVPEYAT